LPFNCEFTLFVSMSVSSKILSYILLGQDWSKCLNFGQIVDSSTVAGRLTANVSGFMMLGY